VARKKGRKSRALTPSGEPEVPQVTGGPKVPPPAPTLGAQADKILPMDIEDEMKHSYLDYAMSVIVGRALPDVRDGLKPVHRRILYAMNEMGLAPNKPHRKSAKVVGEVLGNYHPHGDTAVYDTLVRLAQDFSCRYPLVDGQGNFGSVDGDPAAAMRYTEVRLASIAMELLTDIDKETVDFRPNYDESRQEPTVLPARLPYLLINGSAGIAVGMATNIPPHNLSEVVDALAAMLDDPEIKVEELIKIVKGPDFPTGGYILGKEGIRQMYLTGRGQIQMQARAKVEEDKKGRKKIIVSEIPYQVNKAQLIESIANLVQNKKIDGITDLRDESDREGMRIVIEIGKHDNAEVILNQLYKHTQMRETFGAILLALVDGTPRVLNLKGLLHYYIRHREEVVTRRTEFDLDKAEKRAHILEGLKIAVNNLDRIIKTIRTSSTVDEARQSLKKFFKLSDIQAQAILDMRLQQLTQLERKKIEQEYLEVIKTIETLKGILASRKKILAIIKDELLQAKAKFGDARRTEIIGKAQEMEVTDLIADEDVAVTISHAGYIKRMPVSTYRAQRRGGRGVTAAGTKEDDFMEQLFMASTHDALLFFSRMGQLYWLKVYEIPEAGRAAKGRPISGLVRLKEGDAIAAAIPVKNFEKQYLLLATRYGMVKKSRLEEFSKPRAGGILALKLQKGDAVIGVEVTSGKEEVALATKQGKGIRFKESKVREMGRTAKGVRGLSLSKDDEIIGMTVVHSVKNTFLTVTEHGFGKRTQVSDYRLQNRGGKGLINLKVTDRTGLVVDVKEVVDDDELMVITAQGITLRTRVKDMKVQGRNTQGVRLIRVEDKDRVVAVARIAGKDEEEEEKK